ncbi:MAG: FHA domain-containing protein [Gammaproteobacteria bacterium]|nr:FHA domain-containing protein [Gammaproteobacteria bacterium]
MATLELNFNGQVIQDIPLNKENITIGRKPDNDIQIDNLSVSSHHAKILTILNDSFVEDMGSTNGTYLNGTLIKKQVLQHNDVIKIGKHELKYINEAASSDDDFEKTMILNPGAEGMPEDAGSQAIDQSVSKIAAEIASADSGQNSNETAKIRVINGTNSGVELPLTKVLTTLGKPGVQVAAITRRPTGYFLIHIDGGDSNSRPSVNDEEIGAQAHPLNNNDVIEVAGVKMSFFFE